MTKRNIIHVNASGILTFQGVSYKCALGKSGVIKNKREGDKATPSGRFPLREVFYRADHINTPETGLPISRVTPRDGWSDDSNQTSYNQKVVLPHDGTSETLWRDDGIYDVIVVIGYNDTPVKKGSGSAIFMHIAKDDFKPTDGCVAVCKEDFLIILKNLTPDSQIDISTAK